MTGDNTLLLIAEFFPPDTEYTAFAERCRALADKFGSTGFTTYVMVLRRSPNDPQTALSNRYRLLWRNRVASTFFKRNFPANTIQRLWAFFDIMKAARRTKAKLILISAHDPMYYVAALTAGKMARVPVITDAHDSRLVLGASTSRGARRAMKLLIERFAMRRADRIWVPTAGLARLIQISYAIPKDHFRVVANGVNLQRFGKKTLPAKNDFVLLHLGGPRAYYDSSTLIRAFKRVLETVPGTTLLFLGVRDDAYTADIIKLCGRMGVRDAVQFLPPAPPEAVSAFTGRSSVGIHTYALAPAYAATIGLKVMEYMAAGLPVLHRGPRGGETWNLVEKQGVGVCAESEEELADQAIALLQDSKRRESLGERGKSLAPLHDWNATLESGVEDARDVIRLSKHVNV